MPEFAPLRAHRLPGVLDGQGVRLDALRLAIEPGDLRRRHLWWERPDEERFVHGNPDRACAEADEDRLDRRSGTPEQDRDHLARPPAAEEGAAVDAALEGGLDRRGRGAR